VKLVHLVGFIIKKEKKFLLSNFFIDRNSMFKTSITRMTVLVVSGLDQDLLVTAGQSE